MSTKTVAFGAFEGTYPMQVHYKLRARSSRKHHARVSFLLPEVDTRQFLKAMAHYTRLISTEVRQGKWKDTGPSSTTLDLSPTSTP